MSVSPKHEAEPADEQSPPGGARVRKIALREAVRRLSSLDRIDYDDAFLVDVGPIGGRTPEQWADAILAESPSHLCQSLRRGWTGIGLKLGPAEAEGSVLGWRVRQATADFVLLGADSRVGLPAELVFERRQDTVLFATLVQKRNPIARGVWAAVEPVHVRVVPGLLERASRRYRSADRDSR